MLIGEVAPVAMKVVGPTQVTVKSRIGLPPVLVGAVKASEAVPGPGVPTPAVGAAGALAVILKPCETGAATTKSTPPAWFAVIEQAPAVTKVTIPVAAPTVQTPAVVELNASAPPGAEAPGMVNGEALNPCAPIAGNVITFGFFATTSENDFVSGGFTPLVAVTLNGYVPAVPDAGVPARTPAAVIAVTPAGRVPVAANVGAGAPVAVAVKVPAEPTVKLIVPALVIEGAEL